VLSNHSRLNASQRVDFSLAIGNVAFCFVVDEWRKVRRAWLFYVRMKENLLVREDMAALEAGKDC
jgi:hypothetical protein